MADQERVFERLDEILRGLERAPGREWLAVAASLLELLPEALWDDAVALAQRAAGRAREEEDARAVAAFLAALLPCLPRNRMLDLMDALVERAPAVDAHLCATDDRYVETGLPTPARPETREGNEIEALLGRLDALAATRFLEHFLAATTGRFATVGASRPPPKTEAPRPSDVSRMSSPGPMPLPMPAPEPDPIPPPSPFPTSNGAEGGYGRGQGLGSSPGGGGGGGATGSASGGGGGGGGYGTGGASSDGGGGSGAEAPAPTPPPPAPPEPPRRRERVTIDLGNVEYESPGWTTHARRPDAFDVQDGAPPETGEVAMEDDGRPERLPVHQREVGTGFSRADRPAEDLDPHLPLEPGIAHLFWIQVGRRAERSIEATHAPLPVEHLPRFARLTVALFPLGTGGPRPRPGCETGEWTLRDDGTVDVVRQPGRAEGDSAGGIRLRFPLEGVAEGRHRLRCSIYHGNTLVQSRMVEVEVDGAAAPERREEPALRSTIDYNLSASLGVGMLERMEHRLSVMLNQSAEGTHGFTFKGDSDFVSQAELDGQQLQDAIGRARGAMRQVAWGARDPWQSGQHHYRYADGALDLERLTGDLAQLAFAGFSLWDAIVNGLAGGSARADELLGLMRKPGTVQVATKRGARHLVPAALFYDRPALEIGAPASARFTLCPELRSALENGTPLAGIRCFAGDCPSAEEPRVVCASGFWGFRHALGMPVSVGDGDDAAAETGLVGNPSVAMAVYRDFAERAGHEKRLKALRAGLDWEYADTYDDTLGLLRGTRAEVVYFYCHGGLQGGVPYLAVGGEGEGILRREAFRRGIRWSDPRPLVFVNGCHTVAVEPENAFELVSGMVENARAAGVMGTEITVFEPLACAFGEAFLARFLAGDPLGEATRAARLSLLAQGNPLGLVYVPFGLAALRLAATGS